MRLVIGSLEVLERLIGNDTEIEIEIRQNIADAFAKRYLKSLIQTQSIKDIENEICKGLAYDSNGWREGEYRKKIKEICEENIKIIVDDILNNTYVYKNIYKMIEDSAEYVKTQLSPSILEERINKLVDKKIKEKLGLK